MKRELRYCVLLCLASLIIACRPDPAPSDVEDAGTEPAQGEKGSEVEY
jgi:hypothetical protein